MLTRIKRPDFFCPQLYEGTLLYTDEHLRGPGVQGVLLLLEPNLASEDVVPLRLLPQVVEMDQLRHRPCPHLHSHAPDLSAC